MPQADHRRYARVCCRRWNHHDLTGCHQVSSSSEVFCNVANRVAGRIAHEKSKYGFVFARRGITMESCSSYFLPRLIGYSRALYLISTGGVLPSNHPQFSGLFAETLPEKAQVLPRALELAVEMSENVSPMASALNRALVWRGPESAEEAHLLESNTIWHMFGSKYACHSILPGLHSRD